MKTEPKTEPSTETKVETKPEGEAKPADAKAPEAYAEFKAPEGFTINKAAVEAALPVFKELGLTQDQAQKLVDIQTKREAELSKSNQGEYTAIREGWRKDVLANADLSAGGKIKPEILETMGRAIDGLGDPALAKSFRQSLDITGVGDNPAFVKAFYKLSQQLTEGRPVQGGGPSPKGQEAPGAKPPSQAKALYPNLA